MTFIIKAIHAFITVGEDGEEGVPAMLGPGNMMMPLLAADPARIAALEPIVLSMLDNGVLQNCRLVRFDNREVVKTYKEQQ